MQKRSIRYVKHKKTDMEKYEDTVTVTATPNGPFIVEGNFKLVDREGKAEMKKGRFALCRCGRSYKQPFCDGTHRKVYYNDSSAKRIKRVI
jgi:hypothetical protein